MKTQFFGLSPSFLVATALLCPLGLQARITPGSKDIGAVWFMGDSITQSVADGDDNSSPRKSLYELLNANGYTYSFTGSGTANIDGLPTTGSTAATNLYQYHTGISGSTIGVNAGGRQDMTAGTPGFWAGGRLATVKPNVILIMLGTNDVDNDLDLANAPARMTNLVNTIFAQRVANDPDPTVMIATIPPNGKAGKAAGVTAFNNALPAVISGLRSQGRDAYLVDHFTPLNNGYATNMRSDNLHTNTTGNNTIAQQWFNKIAEIIATPAVTTISVTGSNASLDTDGSPAAGYATAATYSADIVANDLINVGQTTLTSAVMDKVPSGAITPGAPGLNNGIGHPTDGASGVYLPVTYGGDGKLPFTYEVTLNISTNRRGYEINQIRSFAGWNTNGSKFANQKYELLVSKVGEAGYTSLGTFTYAPFGNSDVKEAAATKMVLTDSSGVIATNVDAVKFVFQDPGFNNGSLTVDGSVYHEIDVIGTALPLPPAPFVPEIKAIGSSVSAETDNNPATGAPVVATYSPEILSTDLINAGQASFSGAVMDKTPYGILPGTPGMNDGLGHPTSGTSGVYLPATLGSGGKLPFTYTATLNTSVQTLGYTIREIRSFAGWNQNGAQLGNQKYEVQVRYVGNPDFYSIGTFTYAPFDNVATPETSSTKMVLTSPEGAIVSGVNAIRFIFMDHGFKRGGVDGTVYHEVDVIGAPTSASGFIDWSTGYNTPPAAANDDDRDGISALAEYGLGLRPTVGSVLPAILPVTGGSQVTWAKGRRAALDPQISYRAWVSTDLNVWTPAAAENVTETSGSLRLKLPEGSQKLFGRLEVTKAP